MEKDLIERVRNAPVVADFTGVVIEKNFYIKLIISELKHISMWPKIIESSFKRGKEFFSNKDKEEIMREKVSSLKGINYTKITKTLEKAFMNINPSFVYLISELKNILGEFDIPIITRDGREEVNHWFNFKRNGISPLGYLTEKGINPILIANEFIKKIGIYTGEISPSEESKLLTSSDKLITSNKIPLYSFGKRNRS